MSLQQIPSLQMLQGKSGGQFLILSMLATPANLKETTFSVGDDLKCTEKLFWFPS